MVPMSNADAGKFVPATFLSDDYPDLPPGGEYFCSCPCVNCSGCLGASEPDDAVKYHVVMNRLAEIEADGYHLPNDVKSWVLAWKKTMV